MIVQLPGTRLIANLITPETTQPSPCDGLLCGPEAPDVVDAVVPEPDIRLPAAE